MNPPEKGLVIAGIVLLTALGVQKEPKILKDAGKCLLAIGLSYCISNNGKSKKNHQTKPEYFQLHQTKYLNQITEIENFK